MASILPGVRVRLSTATNTLRYSSHTSFVRTLSSTAGLSYPGPDTAGNISQAHDPHDRKEIPNVSKTNEVAVGATGAFDKTLQESAVEAESKRQMQAPNRDGVWSRSQMPREMAMRGPRFEQTIIDVQPRPYAAIDLIHQQPVRWVDSRMVACDGGGGPLGHPKIFINVDKPKICWCTYCGLPYAHKHHKKHIESLPSTTYPLKPTGDPAQVQMPTTPSQLGEIDGQYPILKGEVDAEGGAYHQR